jgi:hypothetical protein
LLIEFNRKTVVVSEVALQIHRYHDPSYLCLRITLRAAFTRDLRIAISLSASGDAAQHFIASNYLAVFLGGNLLAQPVNLFLPMQLYARAHAV